MAMTLKNTESTVMISTWVELFLM